MTEQPMKVTPDSDDDTRLNRILEMQRDLAFLFRVNWCDVDRRIRVNVLKHAVAELETGLRDE